MTPTKITTTGTCSFTETQRDWRGSTTTTTTKHKRLRNIQRISLLEAVKRKRGGSSGNKRGVSVGGGGNNSSSGGGFGNAVATPHVVASGITGHSGSGSKVLRKAANNFDRIRKENVNDVQSCSRDVYVRSPLNSETTFWFVGKIARAPQSSRNIDDVRDNDDRSKFFNEAALAQKRLIFDYSKDQLRPQNMGGKYAPALEVWLAPGDSEMDVATNKVCLTKVIGNAADLPEQWDANQVGYNPEIYLGDEITKGGLRVERNELGQPIKAAYDIKDSIDR